MAPIQDEVHALLERGARKSKRTRFHRVFANNLLKIWPALWTFLTVDGVEPTNNAAERALRGPVIYRKLSQAPNPTTASASSSARSPPQSPWCLQERSLFAYLRELLTAHARGDPLPRSPDRGLNAYKNPAVSRAFVRWAILVGGLRTDPRLRGERAHAAPVPRTRRRSGVA
jgi:Transposase IS66 family